MPRAAKVGDDVLFTHPTIPGIFPAKVTGVHADGQHVTLTVFSPPNPWNVGPVAFTEDNEPAVGFAHWPS